MYQKLKCVALHTLCASAFVLSLTNIAHTEEAQIAAVVGESVVSVQDVKQRIATMRLLTPSIQGMADNVLFPQVMQMLVDEALYEQEAKRLKINVNEQDIARTVRIIEKQNNQKEGSFYPFLAEKGISKELMEKQIHAQVTWSKIIALNLRPRVTVTQQEINEMIVNTPIGASEVQLKQWYVPITADMKPKAINQQIALFQKLRAKVSSCEDMSTYSADAGSTLPADVLTIPVRNLHSEIRQAINNLPPEQPSEVIHSPTALQVVMACGTNPLKITEEEREKISEAILQKKLAREADHYLRELRRNTMVEMRVE